MPKLSRQLSLVIGTTFFCQRDDFAVRQSDSLRPARKNYISGLAFALRLSFHSRPGLLTLQPRCFPASEGV